MSSCQIDKKQEESYLEISTATLPSILKIQEIVPLNFTTRNQRTN